MFKVAKGAKDLCGDAYSRIKLLIDTAESIFVSNGGVPLDTPVFERTDVLLGKYGEEAETKLIYKLADQGGEDLSLRYDLTVPFVRYVKENAIKKMRRYAIGKVYRRDEPNARQGRFREFYQADFDILGGKQDGMVAEATILNIAAEFMSTIGLNYTILVNDVRNLQTMLETKLGIPNWRQLTPIIDKLDKQPFDSLIPDMKSIVPTLDVNTLRSFLEESSALNPDTQRDFATLKELASVLGYGDKLVFSNTLARGLDYYTGFIWEVKIDGFSSTVSAGGRYDNLLNAPTVGISIGISRISSLIEPTNALNADCFVTTVGNIPLIDKMRAIKYLRDSNKYSSVTYDLTQEPRSLTRVSSDVAKAGTRFLAVMYENEWITTRTFTIKDFTTRDEVLVRM